MCMSKMGPRGDPESCRVSISALGMELSKAVRGIGLGTHEGAHSYGFRSNVGKDIKRVSKDDIREVRDHSNAVPSIRSIIGRCINGQGSMRKSRGRFRT
jgi:hypothetical protein